MRLKNMIGISAILLMASGYVIAEEANDLAFNVKLTGFKEAPPILTNGRGVFKPRLDKSGTMLSYTLTFSDLPTPATVAHIHFGQMGGNGGVVTFLCGGGSKPACPAAGGTVMGTIVAADIMALPAQGINAGNFTDFLNVLRSGKAYVNVHTIAHPSGEIRGQIKKHYVHQAP